MSETNASEPSFFVAGGTMKPAEESYVPYSWEIPHQSNLTGSAGAYRPDGSLLNKGERPRVSGDYDAWSPE